VFIPSCTVFVEKGAVAAHGTNVPGRQEQANHDQEFAFTSISFNEQVANAFDELQDRVTPELAELYAYWEDTFVGRLQRRGRTCGRFPIECWNVNIRVTNELPRTNNSIEAWHRSFQQTLECHHPSVYKLVKQIRKEQDFTEQRIERFRQGEERDRDLKLNICNLTKD
jgi:hypothetical protein